MSVDNSELRCKIDEAKQRLPLPKLMRELGYDQKHIGKTAYCPFHSDEHKSFSVFHGTDGKGWQWKCHTACGSGDEIALLVKQRSLSTREAITLYLDMAGFPPSLFPTSREYPQSHQSREYLNSRECPEYPVSPVSNGHGLGNELEEELEGLGFYNACEEHGSATKRRFQLARDVRALEKKIGRQLTTAELMLALSQWHDVSQPFLDSGETRDDHFAMFLAELTKVRVPTGEGNALNKALECVRTLSVFQLPDIPEMAHAREPWRRLAALHRELARLSTKKDKRYFLSYSDAAKASPDLSPQKAHDITRALERVGVIKIVRVGVARPSGGKASEFRYLLPSAIQPF